MKALTTAERLKLLQQVLLRLNPHDVNMMELERCHFGHFCRSPEGQSLGLRWPESGDCHHYEATIALKLARAMESLTLFSSMITREKSLENLAEMIREYEMLEMAPCEK